MISFFGYGGVDQLLNTVGVLIFVHHDLRKLLRNFPCHLGGGAVAVYKKPNGKMLLIGKVHLVFSTLFLRKLPIELAHQFQEGIQCRCECILFLNQDL